MWHQNNRRVNTSRISKPARDCGRNRIFRGRNWDSEQNVHNVLVGIHFPEAQLLPVWLSKVGLGGGGRMCIYLTDCLGYYMICYWRN